MTGNNRRANAGRPKAPKHPQPQRKSTRKMGRGQVINAHQLLVPLQQSNANYRPMNNRFTTVSGSEFLGKVSTSADPSTVQEAIRKVIDVSPSSFPGTRMTQLAALWERYRFRRFRIRYVPAVPNTVSCQFVLYQDTDPTDDPTAITDVDALIRQATSQAGSQQWNFNSAKSVELAQRGDKELYYTGPSKTNARFALQGRAYLVQITNQLDFNGVPATAGAECGSLFVDWEADFQTPQINPDAVVRALEPVAPPPTPSSLVPVSLDGTLEVTKTTTVRPTIQRIVNESIQGTHPVSITNGTDTYEIVTAVAGVANSATTIEVTLEPGTWTVTSDGVVSQADLVFEL